jgi:DNA recombination protein RmuC
MGDKLQQQERMLRETLQKQEHTATASIGRLNERLAVISSAQKNISDLSGQIGTLQNVLDNKQARGLFGEFQLENLVRSALPPDSYALQHTLSNGRRVDCLILFPNPPGPTSVDSKFPLESYRALTAATTEETRKPLVRTFAADIVRHLEAIAERYIIPGETAESALMFVPSETVFSEIHAHHEAVVKKGHQLRVYIVSPSTLWATLNTMRAILKDIRMQEQAGIIQAEVAEMVKDTERLDQRIASLERNYNQMAEDFRKIRISTDKIIRRAANIDSVEIKTPEDST